MLKLELHQFLQCIKWSALLLTSLFMAGLPYDIYAMPEENERSDDQHGGQHAIESLKILSRNLQKTKEFYAEMEVTYLTGGFGGSVVQGPTKVSVLWNRPSLYVLHEETDGSNPSTWYLLAGDQLTVYEEWPVSNDQRARTRGFTVKNIKELAGSEEEAFQTAYRQAEHFTHVAHEGLRYIEMLRNVRMEALEIAKTTDGWTMTISRKEIEKNIPEWMRQADPDGNITFELMDTNDGLTLISISATLTSNMSEARVGSKLIKLSFDLEKQEARIPVLNSGRLKMVALTDIEELNEDLMYLPLVLQSKAGLRPIDNKTKPE